MKNRIFWIVSIFPIIILFLISIPFCIINLIKGKGFCIVDDSLMTMTDIWMDNVDKAIRG